MYLFKEHLFGASASDEAGMLIGNFANWTTVCNDKTDHICDPTEGNGHIKCFSTHKVYATNYTKWPRREEICQALSIPVYDSPPYNTIVEAIYSFCNFMKGFYVGNESCDISLNAPQILHDYNSTIRYISIPSLYYSKFEGVSGKRG